MSALYKAYVKRPAGVTEYERVTMPSQSGGVSIPEQFENWLLIDYNRRLYPHAKFTPERCSAVSRSM